MIIQLMGGQNPPAAIAVFRQAPYSVLITEFQVPVAITPAAPTLLFLPLAGFSYLIILRNSSPAAQTIRVGLVPSYVAPIAGMILLPGDNIAIENMFTAFYALGSAAGAVLDESIWRTA